MTFLKEKITIIFFLLQPFLDVLAGLNILNGIHLIIRGLFFLYCFYDLIKEKKNNKIIILLTTIMFIYFCSYLSFYHYNLVESTRYTLKLFYLPFTMLFFYNNKEILKEKYIYFVLFTYLILLITFYIFNIGGSIYKSEVKKVGFKGLFNSINEFSAIIIILFPLTLNFFKKKKKLLYSIITVILILIVSIITGTKVILGGILITSIYFLTHPFINLIKKQNIKKKIIILLIATISTIGGMIIIKNTTAYQNAIIQAKFFKVKKIISIEGINKVIFNDRFSFIPSNQKDFNQAKLYEKLLGLKYNESRKTVEIDFFDLLYQYGIIGLLMITSIIIYYGYKSQLKNIYLLTFVLLILISETSGHVLIYPTVSLYFGIIINLNKPQKTNTKRAMPLY